MITAQEISQLRVVYHGYCGFPDGPCLDDPPSCGGVVAWGVSEALGAPVLSNEYPSPWVVARYLGRREPTSLWSGPTLGAIERLKEIW